MINPLIAKANDRLTVLSIAYGDTYIPIEALTDKELDKLIDELTAIKMSKLVKSTSEVYPEDYVLRIPTKIKIIDSDLPNFKYYIKIGAYQANDTNREIAEG